MNIFLRLCGTAVRYSCALLLLLPLSAASAADYSKEPLVIQDFTTRVTFTANGERDWQQKMSVRVQSEAAVREYGVLGISYNADSEQVEFDYVRVHKPDGSVIETPVSSAMDVSTPVAMTAPTYSDLRQKQLPVKSLGVGDVLEYSLHNRQNKPDVPGQFWYEQMFPDNLVVLKESLEIRTPKEKYVQIASPKLKNETHEESAERVYIWKYSQLEASKPVDPKKQLAEPDDPPKVQLTTFRNWEEVGRWWGMLAAERAQVTPQIEAKARELTRGASSDLEKARAIYAYVAMRFRYISISFGEGRYQPHSASEVLANQYGDCKDKHTLLASLLKAAGIEAWPALIGAGLKFDATVPSPAQFNHVITVLPQNGKYVWLDSTSEVAPFGLLALEIRDEQALVIPSKASPQLLKTPADPPFVAQSNITVKSSLNSEGTLTAHFDFDVIGDDALAVRGVLHQLAPSQWQALMQQMSYGMNYAGDVSAVSVDHLEEIDRPLHYGYDYTRKNYSDWAEHKITPPVPPFGFGPGEDAEKPKEPFWAGAPGNLIYHTSVALPQGFTAEVPKDVNLTSAFADYAAHYSLKDNVFFAERRLTIKKSKVAPEQWAEYQKFIKAVYQDQREYTVLNQAGKELTASAADDNPEASQLVQQAMTDVQSNNIAAAWDDLARAERINPNQTGIWGTRAMLESTSANQEQAIADFRKEVELHPDNIRGVEIFVSFLVHTKRFDEAIRTARDALLRHPESTDLAFGTGNLLMRQKRYAEIPPLLEKPLSLAPDNARLQSLRTEALLRSGKPQDRNEAITQALKLRDSAPDPLVRNDLAYALADTGTAIALAEELAAGAITKTEEEAAKPTLADFQNADLSRMVSLSAEWDTLGWVYFKQCDTFTGADRQSSLQKAEQYINASWQLNQQAAIAEHLGEIYNKIGRREAAIKMWRYALALNSTNQEAKDHLHAAGAPEQVKPTLKDPSPGEQLGRLRTIGIPALPKQTASAEFFVLISRNGAETQFISGSDPLKTAGDAISSGYKFPFPDDGPEKVIRRGILSCSIYTAPSCQLTLLLPATVHK